MKNPIGAVFAFLAAYAVIGCVCRKPSPPVPKKKPCACYYQRYCELYKKPCAGNTFNIFNENY
ncbi:MAG: hypothetical protein J5762_03795 [Clostridia bacterium]|nr:hypothetical protein [Clostridia bacterium]